MNILYGVSGEGFGHASRALVIGKYLEKKGHKVKILTHGQALDILKEGFDVFEIRGLHLSFNKGRIKKRRTVYNNLKNFPLNFFKINQFKKLIHDFRPDICITDMEFIVPILSFLYKIPLISMDNQHSITNLNVKFPRKDLLDYILASLIIEIIARRADYFIVLSFFKEKISKKNTFIAPPFIREEVKKLKPKSKDKILVYLSKENQDILNILRKINKRFIVYGYNIMKKEGNLEFKIPDGFFNDLKDCKAIIASAGFSLISEAIYLKKPYFAVPLKGHFEQILNAVYLKKQGFGDYNENLDERDVFNFLKNLDRYKKNLKKYNPDYNKIFKILDKVLKKFENRNL